MRSQLFKFLCQVIVWTTVGAGSASAYETAASMRSFADKYYDDNSFVIEVLDQPVWESSILNSQQIGDQQFTVSRAGNSIEITMTTPSESKMKSPVRFSSLDPMFDEGDIEGRSYNYRLFFSRHLIWVESRLSGVTLRPTHSTVFFIGVPSKVFDYYMMYSIPNVNFYKESELKDDIMNNYASKYNPFSVGTIEYGVKEREIINLILN